MVHSFTPIPLSSSTGWAFGTLLVPICGSGDCDKKPIDADAAHTPQSTAANTSTSKNVGTYWQIVDQSPQRAAAVVSPHLQRRPSSSSSHHKHKGGIGTDPKWILIEPVVSAPVCRTNKRGAIDHHNRVHAHVRAVAQHFLSRLVVSQQLCSVPETGEEQFRSWLEAYAQSVANDLFAARGTAFTSTSSVEHKKPIINGGVVVSMHVKGSGFLTCFGIRSSVPRDANATMALCGHDAADKGQRRQGLSLVVTLVGFLTATVGEEKEENRGFVSNASTTKSSVQDTYAGLCEIDWACMVEHVARQLYNFEDEEKTVGAEARRRIPVARLSAPRLCLSVDSRATGSSLVIDMGTPLSSSLPLVACHNNSSSQDSIIVRPQILSFYEEPGATSTADQYDALTSGSPPSLVVCRGEGEEQLAISTHTPCSSQEEEKGAINTNTTTTHAMKRKINQQINAHAATDTATVIIEGIRESLREAARLANLDQREVTSNVRKRINALMEGAMASCEGFVMRTTNIVLQNTLTLAGCGDKCGDDARTAREDVDAEALPKGAPNSRVVEREYLFPPRVGQQKGLRLLNIERVATLSSSSTLPPLDEIKRKQLPDNINLVPFLPTLLVPPTTQLPRQMLPKFYSVVTLNSHISSPTTATPSFVLPRCNTYGSDVDTLASWITRSANPTEEHFRTLWLPRRNFTVGGGISIESNTDFAPIPYKNTHVPLVLPPRMCLVRQQQQHFLANDNNRDSFFTVRNVIVLKSTVDEDSIVFIFERIQHEGKPFSNTTGIGHQQQQQQEQEDEQPQSFALTYTRVYDARSVPQLFDLIIDANKATPIPRCRKGLKPPTTEGERQDKESLRAFQEAAADIYKKASESACEVTVKEFTPSNQTQTEKSASGGDGGYLALTRYYNCSGHGAGGDSGGSTDEGLVSGDGKGGGDQLVSAVRTHFWSRGSSCRAAGYLELFELTTRVACEQSVESILVANESKPEGVAGKVLPSVKNGNGIMGHSGLCGDGDAFTIAATFIEWTRAHVAAWLN